MTKTELANEVILECIPLRMLDKRAIAKKIVEKYPDKFKDIEDARVSVRVVLGERGRDDCPEKYTHTRQLYNDTLPKKSAYDLAKERETVKSKYYIVTSAVNNTPVHTEFWKNLLAYANHLGAQIHVIAIRYKNPTSVFSDAKEEFWTEDILPYLDASRHEIHSSIAIMSDVKIQPTVENPLSGMEGMSGERSCVFGHPRVQLQFTPVLKGSKPKIMLTTGSCTESNYTDSKQGKKGDFHHTLGFTLISIKDKDTAFIRQVTARKDGGFIDLKKEVKAQKIWTADTPKALVLGDIHAYHLSVESKARIHKTIDTFKPETVVLHDVFDGESVNPHMAKNAFEQYKRNQNGKGDLDKEITYTLDFVKELKEKTENLVIVNSNHDTFLDRYVIYNEWQKDLVNAKKYLELAFVLISGQAPNGLFAHLADKIKGVKCLGVDDSFQIGGIELGNHGDKGANGSRGIPTHYRRLSTKVVTGHTHSPLRKDGHLVTGCQDLDHGYNVGMSSWGLCDVIINSDGKMQQILYFNNDFQ